MSDQLHYMTISELAPLIRDRKLSSAELTEAVLARIGQLDDRLAAFITVTVDQARSQAAQADEKIARGLYHGPLHGIPVGLKDLFDVAGIPCTFGSKIWRGRVPTQDSTAARRMREAGAVLVGKHNLHEFAHGPTNENPHFGTVHNPWMLERIAGGSSGGTASAIAAGLSTAGLGSDTGGSVRIPASLCGIVGIKPTYGRISRHGMLPASWSLDHAGAMARSVLDCALVLQTVSGFDPLDPSTSRRPVPDFTFDLEAGVRGLRLGVPSNHFFDALEPDVASVVETAIGILQSLGARLVKVSLPNLSYGPSAVEAISCSERCSWHDQWMKERPQDYGIDVLRRMRVGVLVRATEYINAQKIRAVIQSDFSTAFRQVDAIITPTTAMVAPPIGKTFQPCGPAALVPRHTLARLTQAASLAGIPALSLPCGLSDGLPVGLQIMGPSWQEAAVFRVARAYERETDWHLRRPEIAADSRYSRPFQ